MSDPELSEPGDASAPSDTRAPIVPDPSPDPTETSYWRPLRLLQHAMDSEIAELYRERGVHGIRPRHTMPLIKLNRRGPMTIRQLAQATEVTHSAMSQTVAALRRDGLVTSAPGVRDARTRLITLTDRGAALVPFLEAEWRATEAAIAELERELPYPLSRAVADLGEALARRSFRDRIVAHLDAAQGSQA